MNFSRILIIDQSTKDGANEKVETEGKLEKQHVSNHYVLITASSPVLIGILQWQYCIAAVSLQATKICQLYFFSD